MKKYIIYIALIAVGLLLGWLLFGNSPGARTSDDHKAGSVIGQMWTCSMHPQILQPEPGNCPICGMDLIPASADVVGLGANQFKLTENAMALANIQTTVIGKNSVQGSAVRLSGKIVENEEANAVQVSYFSGRIERLNVSVTGESITKGQLLATVYSPELFAAQQELLTAASLKESQPSLYNAVRKKLKLWKLSDNQIDQIENSGKVKENFPIYATVSGTVSEKMVAQGDFIKQGQALLKIANLATVWANFDAYENQINLFKKGQEVLITTNAYPNQEFKAKVSFIDPVLDSRTRTVKLRAVLKNPGGRFKPGMFLEGIIKIAGSANKEKLTLPSSAILWTGERSVVYIKPDPGQAVFEMREVSLGSKLGDNYEVLEGLESGDEIVTNGTFTIDAAAQLQGKKSMMNKEGARTMTGHEAHSSRQVESSGIENMKLNLSPKFQEELLGAISTYIKMKDAFVQSDPALVSDLAKEFLRGLQAISTNSLGNMEKAHFNETLINAKTIAAGINIDNQRKHFISLNQNLVALASNLTSVQNSLYILECPMADNNKGATWLSFEKKVLNPYFGDLMLNCGIVIKEIN